MPVGMDWMVGTLLYNALTCMHGNQISMVTKCWPPSLEEYFSLSQTGTTSEYSLGTSVETGINSQSHVNLSKESMVNREL